MTENSLAPYWDPGHVLRGSSHSNIGSHNGALGPQKKLD